MTCTFGTLHGRDTHLLARATTLNCRGLPDGLPHGLRATLWCPFLTPTTPTLPLLAPKKPSIRPEPHQNLTTRPHQFRGAHVHPDPCAVSHQFSIPVHLAASAIDLPPPRHLTPPVPAVGVHTSWARSTSMSQPFHPPIIESSESLASGHTPVTAVRRRQRLPVTQNQAQPWVDSESRRDAARARAAAIAAATLG